MKSLKWLLVSCLLSLGACELVAPLEDLQRVAAADAGGPCMDGDSRCSGLLSQSCNGGVWETTEDCEHACNPATGECGECALDDKECVGGSRARFCNSDYTWAEAECDRTCKAGVCVDSCREGERTCAAGELLQICEDEDFVTLEQCEAACVGDECTGVCRPGDRRCSPDADDLPELCDDDGQWQSRPRCEEPNPFCAEGRCGRCEPDDVRCNADGEPEVCSAMGDWMPAAPCEAPTAQCVSGECVTCEPGRKRCTGDVLQQCAEDGSRWDTLEECGGDAPACVTQLLACGKCNEGDKSCNDQTPRVCDDQGQWVDASPCEAETPECVAGECAVCNPKLTPTRCTDAQTMETCEGGEWATPTPCTGDTPVCRDDTGRCGCDGESRRCDGDDAAAVQACVLGEWVDQPPCVMPSPVCLPSTGQCAACLPGEEQCISQSAHVCNDQGVFQALNSCSGTEINCGNCDIGEACTDDDDCNSKNCEMDVCRPAEDCSNGIDDDLDNDVDCADSDCDQSRCLNVPPGWSGPVVVATTDGVVFPSACPLEFSLEALTLQGDPLGDPVSCAACSCMDDLSCGPGEVRSFAACDNSPAQSTSMIQSDECVPLSSSGVAFVGGLQSGTCSLSGGGEVTNTPASSWGQDMLACGQSGPSGGGCAAQQVCLPNDPPSEFEAFYCVHAAGDVSCPAGYPNKRLFFTEFEDSRDCSPCSCDPTGDCQTNAFQSYDAAACGGSGLGLVSGCSSGQMTPCACQDADVGSQSVQYSPTLQCTASGGEPTGSVDGKLDSGVTVCCE